MAGFDRLEHLAEGGEAFEGDGSEQAGLVAEELVQGSRRRTCQNNVSVEAVTVANDKTRRPPPPH